MPETILMDLRQANNPLLVAQMEQIVEEKLTEKLVMEIGMGQSENSPSGVGLLAYNG